MLQTRPQFSEFLLERPRLLQALPDEPGYVVWLEAPYGYGKSVLLGQWAARLEEGGRRVVWLSLAGHDARSGLARALDRAEETPWPLLLAALREQNAALVLEDLEGNEGLGPLLHQLPGLVALASRGELREPELPRLQAQGRLVHLGPAALAFTLEEAGQLFPDRAQAQALWQRCGGWPLPLHLGSLSGGRVLGPALWAGLRESLTDPQWAELLLLSALNFLPANVADERVEQLSRLGFVQRLEGGFRLHPLAAGELAQAFPRERACAVRQALGRLPLHLRAEACTEAALWPELAALLENHQLADQDAPGVLRWEALCGQHGLGEGGPGRALTVGWALSVLGQRLEARRHFLRAARHRDATPEQRVQALSWAVFELDSTEAALHDTLLQEARPHLEQVTPSVQAIFWGNAAAPAIQGQRWEEARRLLDTARQLEPRSAIQTNLAQVNWELGGQLEAFRRQLGRALEAASLTAYNRAGLLGSLGQLEGLLDPQRALGYYDQLAPLARQHPLEGLKGRAAAAAIRQDLSAFAPLEEEARAWAEHPLGRELLGFVIAQRGRCLREAGQVAEARARLEVTRDLGTLPVSIELALCLHELGETPAALDCLRPALGAPERLIRLHAWAAQYRLTRDPAALEEVLRLTSAGALVLPALLPIAALPPERPELSRVYPLREVLCSGQRAAIRLRQDEIPPLDLRLLGGFEVRVLGEAVALQARPRELLALLALGYSRAEAAEALWPEADAARSRNNLHVNLNTLRRALEPWGLPSYLGETGLQHFRCDVLELQAALECGDWQEVRRLYRPLLPDSDLPPVARQRDALHQRVVDGGWQHSRSLPGGEAEPWLRWLLDLDPLHEPALERLLTLLCGSGRRHSAGQLFQRYQRQLSEELGLEPGRALRRVLESS